MYARLYHGCNLDACEHLPSPAMLTIAALVNSEDDLRGNTSDGDAAMRRLTGKTQFEQPEI